MEVIEQISTVPHLGERSSCWVCLSVASLIGGSMCRRQQWVVCFISAPLVLKQGGLSEGQWPQPTTEGPVINVQRQSRTLQ